MKTDDLQKEEVRELVLSDLAAVDDWGEGSTTYIADFLTYLIVANQRNPNEASEALNDYLKNMLETEADDGE